MKHAKMPFYALGLAIASLVAHADDATPMRVALKIEPQPVRAALKEFSAQSGVQVLLRVDNISVDGVLAPKVDGELTVQSALNRLLANTGLKYEFVNDRTVRISAAGGPASSSNSSTKENESPLAGARAQSESPRGEENSEKQTSSPTAGGGEEAGSKLEEIIVTAQKRIERLQDVPVPVTAINAKTLVDNNQLLIRDYYASIPGLSLAPAAQSEQNLAIRGITTGSGAGGPTVGITVDDVPFGASTGAGGGRVVPDIDPSDLARIEVLRGPQGTLYGASSMGGLLKFVTVDPSTDAVSGRVQAGISSVHNGGNPGYSLRASVNLPLGSQFAVRASGFTRQDPGYIDNPVLNIDGVNEVRVSGGRLSALWQPSESLSLKLSALYQKTEGDGSNAVEALPGLGDLEQNDLRGTGRYDRTVQSYGATVLAKLGRFDLTSVSGFNINEFSDSFDYTFALAGLTEFFFPGNSGTPLLSDSKTDKFSQEIRLSSPAGERFEWLLGAFYTNEDSHYNQRLMAANPSSGVIVGEGYATHSPSKFEELAAFGDLTVHMSERFDVQLGGRQSHIEQSAGPDVKTGLYVPIIHGGSASPYVTPGKDASANSFTYLLTPRWRITPEIMTYARFASGYRAGGANCAGACTGLLAGQPAQFDSDKTQNYELGVKGDFLDRRLSLDASVYYIDWKQIQIFLINPQSQTGYTTNGSDARSKGIELSMEARPWFGTTLSAWVTWADAELSEDFPASSPAYGASGDRLPYSSRFSGNLSLAQEFPVGANWRGFVGGSLSYVGNRVGAFQGLDSGGVPLPRQILPGYAKTDVRAGVRRGPWTANLFVTNVSDKRGMLTGGAGYFPPFGFEYIQPRTVGMNVLREF